jgi:hypothetical protein
VWVDAGIIWEFRSQDSPPSNRSRPRFREPRSQSRSHQHREHSCHHRSRDSRSRSPNRRARSCDRGHHHPSSRRSETRSRSRSHSQDHTQPRHKTSDRHDTGDRSRTRNHSTRACSRRRSEEELRRKTEEDQRERSAPTAEVTDPIPGLNNRVSPRSLAELHSNSSSDKAFNSIVPAGPASRTGRPTSQEAIASERGPKRLDAQSQDRIEIPPCPCLPDTSASEPGYSASHSAFFSS